MKYSLDNIKSICRELLETIFPKKKYSLSRKFQDNSNQYNLTPVFIEQFEEGGKNNPQYSTVLDIANKIGNTDVKNIALTGPYGAGKSSIIRTLERDFPGANYLNISLATLEDDTFFEDNPNQKSNIKSKDEINHLIEYSILQQIIYKEKAQKLRQSRLKRIQNISWAKSTLFALLMVAAVIAIIVLFQPDFLMVDTLCEMFACSDIWKKIWDTLCLFYLIVISIFIAEYIIEATHNSRINKLNLKDGEIGIEENNSIFNKHLDEIIYFFEVTKYNVVVIEDLDRFDTTHIFLKLRELNQLLNASNAIRRRIVFIYAIRDDMFTDTNRTKFFDYIATVIPVINSSNACDMLKNALSSKGVDENEIDDKTCRDLGLYIDDMRILYNIVDEYLQYRKKIDNKLILKKLLGIILYKNYFPQDFANLHYRKGFVYTIISHKTHYIEEINKAKQIELDHLEKQYLEDKDKYRSINGKELRTIYVSYFLLKTDQRILSFVNGNDKATPQQLIDDEVKFLKLMNGEYPQFEYSNPGGWPNPGKKNLNITFKDVEKSLDNRFGYLQRLNYETEILKAEKDSIEKLQNTIDLSKQLSLAQLLRKHDIKTFQSDLSNIDDKNHLVEFLIKEGYIDEYYYDYISYFYPGTLTQEDKEFITTLRVGKNKEYHYQLYKFESVIRELPEKSYMDGSVLNISLVKFLTEHLDERDFEFVLNKVLVCIKRRKEQEFVVEFYKAYPDCAAFFERLFDKWPKFDMDCLYNKEEKGEVPIQFEAFLRYVDLHDIEKEDHYIDPQISRNFEWINTHINTIGIDKIKNIIQTRGICFDNIMIDKVDVDLMEFISNGLYYEYTEGNLKQIVRFHSPEKIDIYEKRSLSVLLELNNSILINDVKNNISDYIKCFPPTSTDEPESSLLLILNTATLDGPTKDYLSKQTQKINNLSVVSENERKIVALGSNVVNPTWSNIICFVSSDEENLNNDVLTTFINSNIELLSNDDRSVLQNEVAENLFTHFITDEMLELSSYRKFRGCFEFVLSNTDLSKISKERLAFLIETRCIDFDDYYYNFIKNQYPQLLTTYITKNKEKYLEEPSLYPIDTSIATELIGSNAFNDKDKAQIIYSFPDELSISNQLADMICELFSRGKLNDLGENEEKLKLYISNASRHDTKIRAVIHYFTCWNVSNDSIKEMLTILGGEFVTIAMQKGLRPNLDKTADNGLLLDFLYQKKYISTYSDKGTYYKVNTRNID